MLAEKLETTRINAWSYSGSTLKTHDLDVKAFLLQNSDVQSAAQDAAQALAAEFERASICPSLYTDPDSGEQLLVMEVQTPAYGPEARRKLRDFVRERLPETVARARERFIFSVIRAA